MSVVASTDKTVDAHLMSVSALAQACCIKPEERILPISSGRCVRRFSPSPR